MAARNGIRSGRTAKQMSSVTDKINDKNEV
jgi:hypothetical protein